MSVEGLEPISDLLGNTDPVSNIPDLNERRNNRYDRFSLKSVLEAKTRPFRTSFFFRTHSAWNDLPTSFKEESDSGIFKTMLKKYMWDMILKTDPD